jgi:integrase
MPKRKRASGEGSIFQLPDGRWRGQISLGSGPDGRRRRKIVEAPTAGAVQRELTKFKRSQHLGFNVAPDKRTFGAWLHDWLQHHVKPSVRPKTFVFYECIVRNYIMPHLGRVHLQRLTAQQVQSFLNARLAPSRVTVPLRAANGRAVVAVGEEVRRTQVVAESRSPNEKIRAPVPGRIVAVAPDVVIERPGLRPKTVRHIHRTLTAALAVAEKFGDVPRNVARLVDPPHVPKPRITFLTLPQAQAFLKAAEGDRLYALYAAILALGLRLGEATGLCRSDVDLEGGRLTVRHGLQRVAGEWRLVDPKSELSRRTVRLPSLVIHALHRHLALQEEEREAMGEGWKGNHWNLVFTSSVGTPLDERSVLRRFQGILARAGLPKMRVHDLRHSAAALLLAQGLGAKAVAELLGHSAVSFTLQTYGHLMEEAKQQTADAMDRVLNPVATVVATVADTSKPN